MKPASQTMQTALVGAIQRMMHEREWTQTQLASHAGLAPATVSRLMNGRVDPRLDVIEKLRVALDVEPIELFEPVLPVHVAPTPPTTPEHLRSVLVRVERLRDEARELANLAEEIVGAVHPVVHDTARDVSQDEIARVLEFVQAKLFERRGRP